ncbi:S8/S53 family peptidase [Bdellovibrionota bacterium FG-2]
MTHSKLIVSLAILSPLIALTSCNSPKTSHGDDSLQASVKSFYGEQPLVEDHEVGPSPGVLVAWTAASPTPQQQTDRVTPTKPVASRETYSLSDLDELERGCKDAGARWNGTFYSCTCRNTGEVYFAGEGCLPLHFSASAQKCSQSSPPDEWKTCLKSPYKELDLSYNPESPSLNSLGSLDSISLKGLITARHASRSAFMYKVSDFGSSVFNSTEAPYIDYTYANADVAFPFFVRLPAMSQDFSPADMPSWIRRCADLTGNAPQCGLLFTVYRNIQKPQTLPADIKMLGSKLVERGENCLPGCRFVTQWNSQTLQQLVSFNIDFREYIPYRRMITVADDSSQLSVYLNANGSFQGFDYKATTLSTQNETYYDAPFSQVVNANETSLGDRRHTFKGLKSLAEFQSQPALHDLMPGETQSSLVKGKPAVLVLDSGLDLGAPGIRSRIQLSGDIVSSIPRKQSDRELARFFSLPIFGYTTVATFNALDLVKNWEHGTNMAALAIRDLAEAELYFVSANGIDPITRLEQELSKRPIDVVNISYDFSYELIDGDERFTKLFNGYPHTLFIMGAGNTRTRNPDICPAKVATQGEFPNVLSVAGTDASGHIDRESSYGEQTALIAAPFTSQCLSRVNNEYQLSSCSGTSVSTALMTNFALKTMLREGTSDAAELRQAIRNQCVDAPLDVKWHCRIETQ